MKSVVRCCALALLLAACQTPAGELSGIAEQPPIDSAVFVTGGAFLLPDPASRGTFAPLQAPAVARAAETAHEPGEPISIEAVAEVLRQGAVFQRVAVDADPVRRRRILERLRTGAADAEALRFFERVRDDGFDLLLVVEELQDGPIEVQGTNELWPLTFATWILLGVGALVPDQTFESRATLRVTVRELQNGRVLHDPLLVGGPIDLALVERTDLLGLLQSVVVPPFWVGDDRRAVAQSVRTVMERRLLLSLARDLKSASVRQRLIERAVVRLQLVGGDPGNRIAADSAETLSVAHLRAEPPLPAGYSAAFERELLASRTWDGERFRYAAGLPPMPPGSQVQVLVGTIRGGVTSATFRPQEAP